MSLPQNARLVFKIPNGSGSIDVDGNPTIAYQDLLILATMGPDNSISKAKWGDRDTALLPGQTRIKGNAIKPKQLPVLPRLCMLEIKDPVTGHTIVGKFLRDLPIQSKFKSVTKALGAKIAGVFDGDIGEALTIAIPEGTMPSLATLPAGQTLSALRVVSRVGGQYFYSNPLSDQSVFSIAGFIKDSVSIGQNVTPIANMEHEDQSWNWVLGRPIFLGLNGTLTQVAPSTGYLQIIARPLTNTAISIEIEEPIQL